MRNHTHVTRMRVVLLCALAAGANAGAVELTAENWPGIVENSGKNAFVKFLAPW